MGQYLHGPVRYTGLDTSPAAELLPFRRPDALFIRCFPSVTLASRTVSQIPIGTAQVNSSEAGLVI